MIQSSFLFANLLTFFFPMFHFDPPKNIRKPLGFQMFSGESKGKIGKKMVNLDDRK